MISIADADDAQICRWLASVFARELSGEAIAAYQSGAIVPILDAVETRVNIQSSRRRLENAIDGWSCLANPQRNLAADYAALFLLPGPSSAPPYASAYLDDRQLFGPANDRMTSLLTRDGLALAKDVHEPMDHVSVMLEYLAHLTETSSTNSAAASFATQDIAPWIETFADLIQRNPGVNAFYPASASILSAYMQAAWTPLSK